MAKELNEDTSFKLSIKTIIGAGFVIATVVGMEFDMKDQMIRNTIMTTQEDVTEIKETLEKIEDKLYDR